jgi:hypothetical protein
MASNVDGAVSCCEMPQFELVEKGTGGRSKGEGGWRRGYKIEKSGRRMSCFRELIFASLP